MTLRPRTLAGRADPGVCSSHTARKRRAADGRPRLVRSARRLGRCERGADLSECRCLPAPAPQPPPARLRTAGAPASRNQAQNAADRRQNARLPQASRLSPHSGGYQFRAVQPRRDCPDVCHRSRKQRGSALARRAVRMVSRPACYSASLKLQPRAVRYRNRHQPASRRPLLRKTLQASADSRMPNFCSASPSWGNSSAGQAETVLSRC